MIENNILILTGQEIIALLEGLELRLIDTVRATYETHARGDSSLPHSLFLRFPDQPRNRIIALPAFLGDGFGVTGLKWVSSFPGNRDLGADRASAVLIMNSSTTGRPEAILEGSIISAKRTAASAALAAKVLSNGEAFESVGMIGCGLINFEIARFLLAAVPSIETFVVYDAKPQNAENFRRKCRELSETVEVVIKNGFEEVLAGNKLVSFATTALAPFVDDLSACPLGSTILHVSLRDLSPEAILAADNIVDDVDHVCRAQTSVHLAEQVVGNRDFMRCTLADVTSGAAPTRRDTQSVAIFSPFGLGVLDIAVGKLVCERAREANVGTRIERFLPEQWLQRVDGKVRT